MLCMSDEYQNLLNSITASGATREFENIKIDPRLGVNVRAEQYFDAIMVNLFIYPLDESTFDGDVADFENAAMEAARAHRPVFADAVKAAGVEADYDFITGEVELYVYPKNETLTPENRRKWLAKLNEQWD
jgi:hypothetical protein